MLPIGSFLAVAKGVSVVCSGGNSGPYPQTVINNAPWVVIVAASTIDREFPSSIIMGNNETLQEKYKKKLKDTAARELLYLEQSVTDQMCVIVVYLRHVLLEEARLTEEAALAIAEQVRAKSTVAIEVAKA